MSSESSASGSDDSEVVSELSGNDERAFREISSRGSMLQSELWKVLDVSSKTGSRIAKRLAEEGLIRREESIADGNRTYELVPVTAGVVSNDGGGDVDDESGTEAESLEDRIVRVVKAHREIVEEAVVRQIDEPVDVVYESIDKAVSEGRIQQTVSEVYGRKRRHLVA